MGFLHDIASGYREWSPNTWWGDYVDVRFRMIEEVSGLRGNVLDVGCNTGFVLSHATAASVHGIDVNSGYLDRAQRKLQQGDFKMASFYKIPYDDGYFDAVLLLHVLEIPGTRDERISLLLEVRRVLRDNGLLLFSTPNNEHVFYLSRKTTGHGLTRTELQDLLGETGFEGSVQMWNPIPSCVHFLPRTVLEKVPEAWWKYLHVPSRVLASIPGLYSYLKRSTDGDCRSFRALWGRAVKVQLV